MKVTNSSLKTVKKTNKQTTTTQDLGFPIRRNQFSLITSNHIFIIPQFRNTVTPYLKFHILKSQLLYDMAMILLETSFRNMVNGLNALDVRIAVPEKV